MAERKINSPATRHRLLSNDSAYPDENDDVFDRDTNGPNDQLEPKTGRRDSGFSSHGHSIVGSSSDSRPSSVHSWHTLSNKTNISDQSSSIRSNGSTATQTKKNSSRFASFVSKHMLFTTSFDAPSSTLPTLSDASSESTDTRNEESARPQLKRGHRKADLAKIAKGVNRPYEYSVAPSTMLGALKSLELRYASGTQFVETGQQVTFGTCAVGFFDDNGGTLALPDDGASLYIPPGAIKAQKPQIVYIYEISSQNGESELAANETWLTPTVECGPSGLKFDKDVLLSLPHSAINHSRWTVNVHRGEETLEAGKDTVIFMDNKKITLAIDHFSPYKVSGRRSSTSSSEEEQATVSKWMKIAVFSNKQTNGEEGLSSTYQLRLCNVQDWKLVLREEGITDETGLSVESLPVSDDGSNIELTVKDVLPDWEIAEELPQFIQFEDVWSNYQEAFSSGRLSVPFQLKTTSASIDQLQTQQAGPICRVEVKQMEDAMVELDAVLPKQQDGGSRRKPHYLSRQRTEDEICREIENRFLAQQTFLDPDPQSLRFLNDTRYRRVCTALDNANSIQKGWAAFAVSMGINDIHIQGSLESWGSFNKRSPSGMLLDFFFFDNYNMDSLDTLKMLSSLFHEIENNTAKAIVDDEINEREQGDQPGIEDGPAFERCDSTNGGVVDENTDHIATIGEIPTATKKNERKSKLNFLQRMAKIGDYVSEKLGAMKSNEERKETQKTEVDSDNADSGASADQSPTQPMPSSKNGLYYKDDYRKSPLSRANSSGVNSMLSRDSSIKTINSDQSAVVCSRKPITSSSSDTRPRFSTNLSADSNKSNSSLTPLSRHGHDSGVYSQRGSSRASSSSYLYDYQG